ncbi:MAG: hypothetical protein KA275_08180, partial [Chitinophagaceae bacterium]|nr:hypothetical protein [Chitinophagaceae bacterium]
MIHKKIFFLLAAILLLSIFIFSKINVVSNFNKNEKMEEGNGKKEMYLKMLADPNTGKIPEGASLTEMEFYRNTFGTLAASKKNRGDAIWENKGPWNVGGRTRAFGMDIRDENILLAGSVSGGIWRSVNGGNSWQKVSLPNEHPGVVSFSQDKRAGKEDIWYALSGELSGTSASGSGAFYLGDGAFRSLDNGQTWQPLTINNTVLPTTFSINYQGGWRIATSPIDSVDACVYMACYGSIYRSIDSGNSWKIVLGIGNNSYYTDVIVSPLGIVYAALSSGSNTKGFFRSADGINFTNITPTFFDANKLNRTVIEINPSNENEVYFLSELEDSLAGGAETSNYSGTKEYVSLAKYEYLNGNGAGAGGNWQNLSQNLPVYGSGFDKFNCQGGYDLMIRFQPNSNYIFVGGTNLYRSTDGFQSKNNTTQIGGYGISTVLQSFTVYPNHHPDQHDVYFVPSNPKKMYSISDGGVIFSENCNATQVEWQNKSLGYVTSQFYQVSINEQIPFDSKMIAGLQDNGNYFTNNNSNYNHWTLPVNGDGSFGYIANDNSFYVMSTQQGNIRKVKLDDRGNLVNKKRIDPAGFTNDNYIFIHPFTVDAKDNNFMFLPIGKQMYRLNNLKSIALNNDNNKLTSGWEKI